MNLRVDLNDHAVDELRRAFEEYELYRGYYRDRGKNPRDAIPQGDHARDLLLQPPHRVRERVAQSFDDLE